MPLSAGEKLGPFEILTPIGAGGMGEVYKARDTKLDREVAMKVLPAALAQDPERLARFEREARVLASLNHPNIAQIYGIEESEHGRALVMELVPGHTLNGALPLDEALRIAGQVADALEAAHEKGIVHRDLKPANIMITPAGAVKVLDFGLAAVTQPPAAGSGDPNNSPTLTMGATQAGMILGTAGYMSPEQAAGQSVDKRADIWSYGVVLWEMLTGQRLFTGDTMAHILVDVLRTSIDFERLPSATPRPIRALVKRCLDRDVKTRLRDIGEARIAIQKMGTEPEMAATAPLPARLGRVGWIAAALVAVAVGGVSRGACGATRPIDDPLMRLNVDLGPEAIGGDRITAAISPDGGRLAYLVRGAGGRPQLATRLLNQAGATPLPATDGAADPFFSPDGQWIGFFADSKMKKISIQGGSPITLCDATSGRGASWGEDGNIIVSLGFTAGLSRVPEGGGTPQQVTKLGDNGQVTDRWPQVLPGGNAVLFTSSYSTLAFEDGNIQTLSLKTGERKTLLRGGFFGRYVPANGSTGYLLYVREGEVYAMPFDPVRLELRGTASPLLSHVTINSLERIAQLDFSRNGTFIYRSGKASNESWPVVWLDRSGKTQPLLATPGFYLTPRFSPDGQRLALAFGAGPAPRIFVHDRQPDTKS